MLYISTSTLTYFLSAAESVADILLKHPRIFEYIADEGQPFLVKGKARIQVSSQDSGIDHHCCSQVESITQDVQKGGAMPICCA
jgi:hypothetical protein